MTIRKNLKKVLIILVLVLSCFLSCFTTLIAQNVYADNINIVGGYSNVLEDLKQDKNFNSNNYIEDENDFSLNIISIAESDDKKLFIYVYQPSGESKNIVATSLFLSTNARGLDYKNYYLTLANKQGVFYKYIVRGLSVSSAITRDYEITSIYRKFNESFDIELDDDNENTINEVQYKVAKHWIFTTTESGVEIGCHDIETIKITDKYVGFCRYDDGFTGVPGMNISHHQPGYDSHFVAFKTDRQIDDLLEADVFYIQQEYSYVSNVTGSDENFGELIDTYSYLQGEKIVVDIPNGLSSTKYEWETIQTPDEFFTYEDREWIYEFGIFNVKKETKLTDEGKKDIEDMDWVLRFALTEYSDYKTQVPNTALITHNINYTIISNVSILRLRFITNGTEYNLGVIDNKQQGDGNPDNYTKTTFELSTAFKLILTILFVILFVVVFAPFLPTVISLFVFALKIIIKVGVFVISIPFKILGAIFKKRN